MYVEVDENRVAVSIGELSTERSVQAIKTIINNSPKSEQIERIELIQDWLEEMKHLLTT